MNYNKILWITLFFFILIGTIQAEWNVSLEDIEKAKIDYPCLHMAILSPKGDYALGYEILDFEHTKRGEVFALIVFQFKKNGKVTIKRIPLKMNYLVGIALNDKDKKVVVVGNYGTLILCVDLKDYSVTKIFEYKKNVGGFRTETLVVQHNNRIFLSGYFYDKEQYWEGDYIVELILPNDAKKQALEFRRKIDLQKVYNEIGGRPVGIELISDKVIYLIYKVLKNGNKEKEEKVQRIYCYNNGKISLIEEAISLGHYCGSERKIYVCVYKGKRVWDTYVKNNNNTGKVSLGVPHMGYVYPFMSENSQTVLFCSVNYRKLTMSIYYAQEKDHYKTKTIYENIPLSLLKLSLTGNAYLIHKPDGIEVDTFAGLEKRQQQKNAEEDKELEDIQLD